MENHPLILTLRLDPESQQFFDQMRTEHFPPERNFLRAHLTLFHHLKNEPQTTRVLQAIDQQAFSIKITGMKFLGAGVAYAIESLELQEIRNHLARAFKETLIPQDLQGYRPHITVQNKVTPAQAKSLLQSLSENFEPFSATAIGLDLWHYLGGPWEHHSSYTFGS
ncbi:2'-5' RNA ligase family protein [Pedobacter sp. CCM 8938]|uniref:2'-5' RNA ligase family protein n=2 Tax=Pedobacter fastidiosus TaxID=2765361 RepID=A0ABR7KS13_9SPHI|nr:2'-5' RNA ligase family protein [Pedobacter fastidiosus]MBC6110883.1 2'-5' RNA ligase family protein [Pedobacter fastidiosus]